VVSKKKVSKQTKKQANNKQLDAGMDGLKALVSLALAYAFGLWAIDKGQIIGYVLTIASLYWAIHFVKESIKKFRVK